MPYVEVVLFVVLGLCFTRYTWGHVRSKGTDLKLLLGCAISCGFLTCRELIQMYSARQLELKKVTKERNEEEFDNLGTVGQAWRYFALLVITLVFGSIVLGVGLPLWVVYFCLEAMKMCIDIYDYPLLDAVDDFYRGLFPKIENFYNENIYTLVMHDPLTFFGLSKSWRSSIFNW